METLTSLLTPDRPIVVAFRDDVTGPLLLRWAAERSQLTGQPILLLHALPDPSLMPPVAAGGKPYGSLIAEARQAMDDESRRVCNDHPGTHVTANVHCGDVVDALLGFSDDAALIVVGADRVDDKTGEYLGSVGQQVALGSFSPVVVIPREAGAGPHTTARSVVVGVDGSAESLSALRVAVDEADRSELPLTVVTSSSNQPASEDSAASALAGLLADLQADYPDVAVSRVIDTLRSPDQSLAFHAASASLLVIGRHGRGARPGILLGSVTHTLLLTPPCPTMVVTRRSLPGPPAVEALVQHRSFGQ
ncbi:universal stress protein [Arthrobacter sp. H5]|uniref:universal stress protein n=1 Tax=Arthrobacter sp. H5 TaxID=1267973 RepID=UPI00047F5DF3|nr:universal stress protein [Arthrobacter sp. H5]